MFGTPGWPEILLILLLAVLLLGAKRLPEAGDDGPRQDPRQKRDEP